MNGEMWNIRRMKRKYELKCMNNPVLYASSDELSAKTRQTSGSVLKEKNSTFMRKKNPTMKKS